MDKFYKRRRYPQWSGSDLADYTHATDGLITNGQMEFRAMGADRFGNTHFMRGIPDRESVFSVEIINAGDGTVRKALDGIGYDYITGNSIKTNKIRLRKGYEPEDDDIVVLKYDVRGGC